MLTLRGLAARAVAPVSALTPLGRGLLLLGALLFLVSLRLHWQEFTQFGAVVIALVLLAWAWAMMPAAPETSIEVHPTRMVAGGRPATARVTVRAGALPLVAPRVEVPVGDQASVVRVGFLRARGQRTVEVPLPALRRGVYDVGPVTYVQADPVGLVSRRLDGEGRATVVVRPQVVDLTLFAGGLTADLEGATSQELSMSDLSFHALREYAKGDDLRHVHWRTSAKADKLLVRQYQESRRGHITVLVDDDPASYATRDDFELAVSIASSVVLRVVREGFHTYFRCGEAVAEGAHANAMLDLASRFVQRPGEYLHDAAAAAAKVPVTGLVVQVSGTRPAVELHRAARQFDSSAQSLILRAHAGSNPPQRSGRGREVVVPSLARLRPLIAAGLR